MLSSHHTLVYNTPPPSETQSYASLASLLELMDFSDGRSRPSIDYMLPGRPDSPFVMSPSDGVGYSTSYLPQHTPTMSKRSHALLELLQSERAYSSDLALIRDVHIPLAIGV